MANDQTTLRWIDGNYLEDEGEDGKNVLDERVHGGGTPAGLTSVLLLSAAENPLWSYSQPRLSCIEERKP